MIKKRYNVIGVMSGTSLDGIDLAYIEFRKDDHWRFKILKAETVTYEANWKAKLSKLTGTSYSELERLDIAYTTYLGGVIKSFINRHKLDNIEAVCSHGHTALHRPEQGLTYQIGNLAQISKKVEQDVVCDFRVQDVALGGQGAPLVPIGDALLFPEYEYCLNLGGFANVSTIIEGKRIAYDLCPVNIVLNKYVNIRGLDYDNKGALAATGKVDTGLLEALNALAFYKMSYPKSLGLEWVETEIFPLINSFDLSLENLLRTFVEHIALQISHVTNEKKEASILVTGGGVFNDFLMSRLRAYSENAIVQPSKEIIEFKEALIFGFLGVLKLRGENNCLSSVTGAQKDHASGEIYRYKTQ